MSDNLYAYLMMNVDYGGSEWEMLRTKPYTSAQSQIIDSIFTRQSLVQTWRSLSVNNYRWQGNATNGGEFEGASGRSHATDADWRTCIFGVWTTRAIQADFKLLINDQNAKKSLAGFEKQSLRNPDLEALRIPTIKVEDKSVHVRWADGKTTSR